MNPIRSFPWLAALALGPLVIDPRVHVEAAEAQPAAARALHDLFDRAWEFQMEENPVRASRLGDLRWNGRWPDRSPEALREGYEFREAILRALSEIDRAALSESDRLNYDLFREEFETDVKEYEFGWHLLPVNQRGGVQTADELADALQFETVQHYRDWLQRLEAFPEYVDQTRVLMERGMQENILLPRIIMERVPPQIDKQIVEDPEASPFYKSFREFPDSIAEQDRERLSAAARQAIREGIVPAFRKFKDFFTQTYLPACYENVGIWQARDGEAMYEFFTQKFTTTGLTPQEIHELGQREVKRIREEMLAIKERVGFEGTLQEFFQHLRTDPKFFYETPEELLAAYRALSKKIDPLMVRLFEKLPRIPYGVESIPEKIAPDTTTAYYRPPAADGSRAGTYFVNLYRPETRPKYEMVALSLHEAVPGHHHQIALAMELGDLPKFRRYGGYTAFIEGWGLYAESLGEELGLYEDPYDKFGQLTYEMWRAVRLVVDTGIHHLKWPRQRAIDFFLANAPKTELDVVNEIDRYITWPGQALAYKIGELKIKELRARAARELSDRFNLKAFHDQLLSSGAVPLDVLERKTGRWIEEQKTSQE